MSTADTKELAADLRRLRETEATSAIASVPDDQLATQRLDFGKYKNQTFQEVYGGHDHYVKWSVEHLGTSPTPCQKLWLRYISLKTKAKLAGTTTEDAPPAEGTEPSQTHAQEFVQLDAGPLALHARMDTLESDLQAVCEGFTMLERQVKIIADIVLKQQRQGHD